MTNNEAAKWIQLYIDLAKVDPTTGEEAYLNEDTRKTLEAMWVAVNALTSQDSDPISRQAVIKAVVDYGTDFGKYDMGFGVQCIKEAVELLPSVQPEQETGRWIDLQEGQSQWSAVTDDGQQLMLPTEVCSVCKKPVAIVMWRNYCPNCGAKMVFEEEQHDA